jgi:hypothetical protein
MAVALILFCIPVVASAATAPGGTFYDDDTSIHQRSIEAIAEIGITRGCNPPVNNHFCPQRPVTRGEMAAFLKRALDLPDATTIDFTDLDATPFVGDIASIAATGITKGCNPPANNHFCPADLVTRGQMAAFLSRALQLPPTELDSFVDDSASVFASAINRLAAAGISKGCNPPANDRFCPESPVTRAEMASFLSRALDLPTPSVAPRPYAIKAVSRSQWGADQPQGTFVSHDINQITIHHSNDAGPTSGPELYRIWQAWHQHLGWPDLAYHFIIGTDGTVYEGRPIAAVGDTATEYDPTGHLLIVVEGSFDTDHPTAAQKESLAQLVAWAQMHFDTTTLSGHRDHAATTCPGDHLYAEIINGNLANRAADIVGEGGVTLWIGGLP